MCIKLPGKFADWFRSNFGNAPSADILTHCKRELMHGVWCLLLDKEFLHAYEHGMLVRFADGVTRRVFPRIFTYSADYPEKYVSILGLLTAWLIIVQRVLLATLKFLAETPCPRCLIRKCDISGLGTKLDARRRAQKRSDSDQRRSLLERCRTWIFDRGMKVRSKAVETVLGPFSWVPTRVSYHRVSSDSDDVLTAEII